MAVVFETERLIVRTFTPADADIFFALQSDPQVMQYIRPPRTREESDTFLQEKILSSYFTGFMGYWVVEEKESGAFAGCFVIIPIPDDPAKTQLGYSFFTDYWGRGYATEVTQAGVQYVKYRTPLPEIYGVTETPNTASQKVLLKAGFQPFSKKTEGEKELLVFILRREQL